MKDIENLNESLISDTLKRIHKLFMEAPTEKLKYFYNEAFEKYTDGLIFHQKGDLSSIKKSLKFLQEGGELLRKCEVELSLFNVKKKRFDK